MGNFTDGLRESADGMIETANCINKGANYIDKGAKIAEYWLNGDKRIQIQAQVALWKKKEDSMTRRYIFLWLVMVGGTIYFWVR